MNVGDVIPEGERLYGDRINVAARFASFIAEPGGICISNKVHEEVRDRVKLAFNDMGDQELKNIARPVRAFAFVPEGPQAARSPPDRKSAGPLPLPNRPDPLLSPTLAVMQSRNISQTECVEEIIVALSRFRSLFVIARNSTFIYKGSSVSITQVGRDLGVRYVLEGSVRKGGGRVRVTAQLHRRFNQRSCMG